MISVLLQNDYYHDEENTFIVDWRMISKEQAVDFFNQYASNMSNTLFGESYDAKVILDSFADYVVGATPLGIVGSKNDEQFGKAIRQGIDFYKRIGITSMNITAQETTILDEFHALVKVYWKSFWVKFLLKLYISYNQRTLLQRSLPI